MQKKVKIGIVGCGAIGSSLARNIKADFSVWAEVSALYDTDNNRSGMLSAALSRSGRLVALSLDSLISRSGLVIECASSLYSGDIAKAALSRGCDIMVMSVGGLLRDYPVILKLAAKYNSRVYIPSGAISGIDALKAAKIAGIKSVTLTTRKNPHSFKGVKYIEEKRIDLKAIRSEKVIFSGAAREAVKYFPQNINVAAVLSLSGIGQDKTRVKIIADKRASRNIHEIHVKSNAGDITTRTENILHPDNPKTSYLAVLSALAMLRQILEPVKIGT